PAEEPFAPQVGAETPGQIVRPASGLDEDAARRLQQRGEAIFADAQRLVEELALPLALLGVEVLFDSSAALLHAVHWAECDATPLFTCLSAAHGIAVKLHDDTRAPSAAGCGKPGCGAANGGCSSCGSEGGGCSSGSCSSGAVKSPEELTAYFAGLRAQMEAHRQRHPLA